MADMWIANGRTEAGDGRSFDVVNPATEDVIDSAPRGSATDVDRAVAAARRAFDAGYILEEDLRRYTDRPHELPHLRSTDEAE